MNDYSNKRVAEIIDDRIHNERNRAILKRRLIDGVFFEPLAEEFDMSPRQIKDIVYKGEEIVFRHLYPWKPLVERIKKLLVSVRKSG